MIMTPKSPKTWMKNLQESRKHLWATSRIAPPASGEKNLSIRKTLEFNGCARKKYLKWTSWKGKVSRRLEEHARISHRRSNFISNTFTVSLSFLHFVSLFPSRDWLKEKRAVRSSRTHPDFLLLVAASTPKKVHKKTFKCEKKVSVRVSMYLYL